MDKNFLPSPGKLDRLSFPGEGDGVRVDTGFRAGDDVTFHYDPMIAKIIAHGADRDAAIGRAVEALRATELEGLVSNIPFLIRALDHPAFRAGDTHTAFVETHKSDLIGS